MRKSATSDPLLTAKQAAGAIGVPLSTFYRWRQEGHFDVAAEGSRRFDLAQVRCGLADAGIRRGRRPKPARGADGMTLADLEHEERRVRLEERQIRLRKLKGELGDLQWMCRYMAAAARRCRDLILQHPARIAPKGGIRLGVDLVKLRAWLDEEMHALATEIADTLARERDTLARAAADGSAEVET